MDCPHKYFCPHMKHVLLAINYVKNKNELLTKYILKYLSGFVCGRYQNKRKPSCDIYTGTWT